MVVINADMIRTALFDVPDPEMPISIVDLGLVESIDVRPNGLGAHVDIDLLPTFVGCPALDMIERDVRKRVEAMDGVADVTVRFRNDPPWSVDRITEQGRADLREHGVSVPSCGPKLTDGTVTLRTSAVPCPFCDSNQTRLDSAFGPTRCRMIYYCDACRNSFEHMKRIH